VAERRKEEFKFHHNKEGILNFIIERAVKKIQGLFRRRREVKDDAAKHIQRKWRGLRQRRASAV